MRWSGVLPALLALAQVALSTAASSGDVTVAKCRAQCSRKLTPDGTKASCLKQEECLRCWASCQAFQRDHYIREYCKLNKACSAGCRQACDFYLTSVGHPAVALEAAPAAAPQAVPAAAPQAVPGVVSGQQTTQAVTTESPSDSRQQGRMSALPTETVPHRKPASPRLQDHKTHWSLHLAELRPGSPLVAATLTWRSRGEGSQYLVTWELRSGGLRGHLVSEEARVSLSLWPREDYVVQVFSGDDASEPLFVSTKTSSPVQQAAATSAATVAVSAVGLVCLAAAAVACCAVAVRRWRRRRAHCLLPAEAGLGRTLLTRNRTVAGCLRPPGKAVAAARLAPLFVISQPGR